MPNLELKRRVAEGRGIRSHFLSFFQSGFFRDFHNRLPLIVSIVINSILWIAIIIKIQGENKPIPLHYSAFYGIEYTDMAYLFLEIPFIGFLLMVLNLFLSWSIYDSEKFLSNLICYATFAVQIVLLIATASVIAINT